MFTGAVPFFHAEYAGNQAAALTPASSTGRLDKKGEGNENQPCSPSGGFVGPRAGSLGRGTRRWSRGCRGNGLGIYAGNPYYWQYHGRPVLLLGGSSTPPGGLNDEGMFLWPNLPATLDKLKAAGGNYTRCLVSGRLAREALWPFARKGDRYDLDQWNEEYWRLFETFLQETQARDIITDIELWATFDYYREPWTKNPFNPKNNVNYTAEQTGLPLEVPSHPARAQNTFFRTLPELDNVAVVLKYQQRFVDKILSYTLRYNHVLYCMDNETAVSPKWGAYWARYVRAAAEKAGRKVPVTEMFDPHDLQRSDAQQCDRSPGVVQFHRVGPEQSPEGRNPLRQNPGSAPACGRITPPAEQREDLRLGRRAVRLESGGDATVLA